VQDQDSSEFSKLKYSDWKKKTHDSTGYYGFKLGPSTDINATWIPSNESLLEKLNRRLGTSASEAKKKYEMPSTEMCETPANSLEDLLMLDDKFMDPMTELDWSSWIDDKAST
jgi:hypothetical protein